MSEIFSQEYFEFGAVTGKSLYENYRWLPNLTIPMAASIAASLNLRQGSTVLDYGCAKGFLVKALRYLGYKAIGYDISTYAVTNADDEVRDLIFSDFTKIVQVCQRYDWIICKDVLEHVPCEQIKDVLANFKNMSVRSLVIVPLSRVSGGGYIAPEYDLDVTHVIREPVEWWVDTFQSAGFRIDQLSYSMNGVKVAWFNKYPTANLFLTLSS